MIINIAKINFKGTGGGSSDVIIKKLTINPSNVEQVKDKTAKVDGYNPVIAPGYNVDDLYNTIITLNNSEYVPPTPPKDENRLYNGNVDIPGLRQIGWTDEDILNLQANVWWYDYEDEYYKVNKKTIDLYNAESYDPQTHKDDPDVIWVPNKNLDSGTDKFSGCKYILGVPNFRSSTIARWFTNCSALRFISGIDASNLISVNTPFQACKGLFSLPMIDFSQLPIPIDAGYFLYNCSELRSIPQYDFSKFSKMNNFFAGCTKLTHLPVINSVNCIDFSYLFSYIADYNTFTEVPGIDFSKTTVRSQVQRLFGYYTSKPTITKFIVNGVLNGGISDNYSIKALTNIDYESVKSILVAASKTTDTANPKTLSFNRTIEDPDGELQNIITICVGKRWIISGLTLI